MSFNVPELVLTILNFIILYFVLRHFFFDKVKSTLEERNNMIRDNIDKAIADREEAEALLAQVKKEKAEAKETGSLIIAQQKEKAEILYDEIVEEAREEAKLIKERGQNDARREIEQARINEKKNILELATLLSRKAIGEDANEETHRKLIDSIIDKVGE